jgi:hypothetical protein
MNAALAIITYFALSNVVIAPKADATCHGSPSHLGTDNIPTTSSTRETTIIDMSFVAKSSSDPAMFWIYQTDDGKNWVQANAPEAAIHLADAHELDLMKKIGAFPCFSKPFPSKDL